MHCASASLYAFRRTRGRVRFLVCLARDVQTLKDCSTIGAGDTFIAGALFGLFYTQSQDICQILNFANELAGRKIAQHGFSGLAKVMSEFDSTI